eukprot:m.104348 g.104348  ORF g.104348 m.104348 type:complete len:106 (+) comp15075_c1_seq1:398-715(+)
MYKKRGNVSDTNNQLTQETTLIEVLDTLGIVARNGKYLLCVVVGAAGRGKDIHYLACVDYRDVHNATENEVLISTGFQGTQIGQELQIWLLQFPGGNTEYQTARY